jgi:hypothetical protein
MAGEGVRAMLFEPIEVPLLPGGLDGVLRVLVSPRNPDVLHLAVDHESVDDEDEMLRTVIGRIDYRDLFDLVQTVVNRREQHSAEMLAIEAAHEEQEQREEEELAPVLQLVVPDETEPSDEH